ncbi:CaiB/BaiF CoA transferase family protein [Natrononativus amylolyticus]|uniref:CaiB/BaiF CoA transferase family protein n=1 Tax=Natrononativus amylolyticus TaxID=2963434 RepID=UPI0020CC5A39|nr:CoA transferase [Natrononativus amylolyticus]
MPLSDVRVVDLSQAVAGPFCAMFLADLGADVVKIERPSGDVYRVDRRELNGKGFNPPFELYNRNKRALGLDLKSDEGIKLFHELVEKADIVIQNWPPGVAAKLRADYEALTEINEDLIYVHVTGYGEDGPDARKPAMDTIIQHLSGFSSLLGYDGDPPIRSQSSLADFYAGYNAAISTLAALRHRDRGNGGQKIDISLLESMMHNMDGAFEYYTNLGEKLERGGRNGFFEPDMLYGAARAADGWVCVALLLYSDRVWKGYCELLDRPELLEKDKYQSDSGRMADAEKLTALFEDWLHEREVDDVVETLNNHGIPAARHNSIAEATNLDQVKARDVFTEVDHPRYGSITLTNSPLRFSESNVEIRRPAPTLGQHNEEILTELEYPPEKIGQLEDQEVIVDDE